MPRPVTPRRILEGQPERVFKPRGVPMGRLESTSLTLDGLEALRLADQEGLYQEEAAKRMGVSRATFARVLSEARRTVSTAILEGHALVIEGGEVDERGAKDWPCPVHSGRRRRGRGCRCDTEAS